MGNMDSNKIPSNADNAKFGEPMEKTIDAAAATTGAESAFDRN